MYSVQKQLEQMMMMTGLLLLLHPFAFAATTASMVQAWVGQKVRPLTLL
jgi:hypothetical protein